MFCSQAACAATVTEAIRIGYRHLDCACDYGNEAEVGQGIAQAIAAGLVTREELWVTSKLWNTLGECKYSIQEDCHTEWVSCVRFSPVTSNPIIVSGGWDKLVKVWNLTASAPALA